MGAAVGVDEKTRLQRAETRRLFLGCGAHGDARCQLAVDLHGDGRTAQPVAPGVCEGVRRRERRQACAGGANKGVD